MTKPTREHLAGLEMALDEMHDMLDGSCEARLNRLIAEAKATPEGEAVAFIAWHQPSCEWVLTMVCEPVIGEGVQIPLYMAGSSHDAELVELLTRCSGFIGAHPSGRNLMTAIDAKLTELRKD